MAIPIKDRKSVIEDIDELNVLLEANYDEEKKIIRVSIGQMLELTPRLTDTSLFILYACTRGDEINHHKRNIVEQILDARISRILGQEKKQEG